MKVAVVTPTYQTPASYLQRCLKSVEAQTFRCTHFLVFDGDAPPDFIPKEARTILLPSPHHDFGNAARAIGSVAAICDEFDAIAFLDADNWFAPSHVESLVRLTEKTGASVCTSSRLLYDTEGVLLGPCPEVDGHDFVDTSCYFLAREAFTMIPVWYSMPKRLAPVGDRVVWRAIRKCGLLCAYSDKATVNYTTTYAFHYLLFGRTPPAGCKNGQFYDSETEIIE